MVSECLSAKDMPLSVRLLAAEALRLVRPGARRPTERVGHGPDAVRRRGNLREGRPESNPGPGAALAGLGAVVKPPPPRKFARNQELFRRGGCVPLVLSGLATANSVGDDQLQLAVAGARRRATRQITRARWRREGCSRAWRRC